VSRPAIHRDPAFSTDIPSVKRICRSSGVRVPGSPRGIPQRPYWEISFMEFSHCLGDRHLIDAHEAKFANVFSGPHIDVLGGARTLLIVPLMKEDVLIGAIGVYRQEVRPFSDKRSR